LVNRSQLLKSALSTSAPSLAFLSSALTLSARPPGPEAALTLLIPLGVAGIQHIVPISFAIIGLLTIAASIQPISNT
jgi:hypothetical protein